MTPIHPVTRHSTEMLLRNISSNDHEWQRVLRQALRGLFGGCLSLLACGCATTYPPAIGIPLRAPPLRSVVSPSSPIQTIVIDAGHGGHDPGTSHYGLKEKSLALDIAKRLRDHLRAAGFTTVMTRESDHFIPLSGRPDVANRLQADLFISVHINANRNRKISGVEVYYPRQSVVSSSAGWPPSILPEEIAAPSTTVRDMVWDLVLGRTRVQSRRLASCICRSMRRGLQVPCHGTKPARFVVLREAWMPAVLVEVGYVTNRAEAGRLGNAEYRQATAESIAGGVLSYARELGAEHL